MDLLHLCGRVHAPVDQVFRQVSSGTFAECTAPQKTATTGTNVFDLFQFVRLFYSSRSYIPVPITVDGEPVIVYNVRTAAWVEDYIGENLYFTAYFTFRVFFVHLLPCLALVVLNFLLVRAMHRAQDRRKVLFNANRGKENRKMREANCTTMMLVVVVTVFLIVEIPLAVITVMHIISSAVYEFLDYAAVNTLILITNFMLMVIHPINFAIYCGMSRQFRETFREIFGGHLGGRLTAEAGPSSKYSMVNGTRTCTNETVL